MDEKGGKNECVYVRDNIIRDIMSLLYNLLGTREIDKTDSEGKNSIKGIINSVTCFDIEIDIYTSVSSILNSTYQFGLISRAQRENFNLNSKM